MSASLPDARPHRLTLAVLASSGRAPPAAPGWELRVLHTPEGLRAAAEEGEADVLLLLEPAPDDLPRLFGLGTPLVLLSDADPGAALVEALRLHAWLPTSASDAQVRAAVVSGARRGREERELRRHQELLRQMLALATALARQRSPEDVVAQAVAGFGEVIAGPGATAMLAVRLGVDDELRFYGVGRYAGIRSDLDLPVPVVEALAQCFGRPERMERLAEGMVIGVAGTGAVAGALFVGGAGLPRGFDALGSIVAGLVGQALSNTVLFQRSSFDALTGLHARAFGLHRLGEVLAMAGRHPSPTSVVAVDVDHFKRVNDTHGHAAGDAVLVGLADLIRGTIRTTDLAMRLGGEEFLIVLPHTDEAAAGAVAERLRRVVAAWRGAHEGAELQVTISAGVAEAEPGERDVVRLIARADDALYAAKREGRNRVLRAG